MSIGKIFAMIAVAIGLMGGCAYALDGSQRDESADAPEIAVTFNPDVVALPSPMESGDYMHACYDMVGQKPGDLAYALELGWTVKCLKSGDELFTGKGDVQTLGYTDPYDRVIALDALSVTLGTIAHEAAHVIDIETFTEVSRLKMAAKYGERVWEDAELYWDFPSEMFAESRTGCLGFEIDPTFREMSCSDVDFLIAQGSDEDLIKGMQITAEAVED